MNDRDFSVLDYLTMPIHREGWPFVALFAAVAALLALLWAPLGWLGLLATLWCAFFFRDPDRVTPIADDLVISPADGTVCFAGIAPAPPELGLGDEERVKISVFMSVFNVHVNRMPVDGVVEHIAYSPGRFLNASLDKASEENERMGLRLRLADGRGLGVVQVAGLVARRIKCDAREGDSFRAGERYGLIRFGSRVDVWLPQGVAAQVVIGQTMIAGETVLAQLTGDASARAGEVR